MLQSETQKLHRQIPATVGDSDPSPPNSDLSLGRARTSRRTSSSHTDSTESGIDVHTPSEKGSEHSPHSPLQRENKFRTNQLMDESESDADIKHGQTTVEIHAGNSGTAGEVIELKSFINGGYVGEAAIYM